MKRFIVTGSDGFVGQRLVETLMSRGDFVIGIDRKSGSEAIDIDKVLDSTAIDVVFHLAAQTSVFNNDRRQILKDNIETFMKVCDACYERGIRLVYASSSTACVSNTTSMYGISKRFDERYAKCYNPNAIGVRLHNVYSARPRPGTLLWHLMNEREVTLYNKGENIRHFTFMDDAINGLLAAVDSAEPLVNVVNPEAMTIGDFARRVQRYNGVELLVTAESRERDAVEQMVDDGVPTLPLRYTSVDEGLQRIFRDV